MKVWRFNDDRKMWLRLGENTDIYVKGSGLRMSMSASGSHIAIPSLSGDLRVFQFVNNTSGNEELIQVGQNLTSSYVWYAETYGIIFSRRITRSPRR